MTEVDHVLWGAEDLDDGVASLRRLTSLEAAPGGSHPGWGTRNALVGLGDAYLEVLATDPAQDGGWLAEEVRSLEGPSLFRWAVRTDDMDAVVARVRAAGLRMEPAAMSRERPDGTVLRWRIAFVEGHDLGPVVPFVIDWLGSTRPSATLTPQGAIDAIAVRHPRPDAVREVLALLEAEVPVQEADAPGLEVTLVVGDRTVLLPGVV